MSPSEDKHYLLIPFQAGWDAACSGVAMVWSGRTSHLLAQEPPSHPGGGRTPSAHTSVMEARGSSHISRPAARCWSCCRVCWSGCEQTQAQPAPLCAQAGEHGREKGAKCKLKPDETSEQLEGGGWFKHKPEMALSENSQTEQACRASPNQKSPPPPGCPAGIV